MINYLDTKSAWGMLTALTLTMGCSVETKCAEGLVDSSCPEPPPATATNFVLRISAPSHVLGAAVVAVEGIAGDPIVLIGAPVRVMTARAGGSWRAIFVGAIAGRDLVRFESSEVGRPPRVTIVDASGGVAQSYQRVASDEVAFFLAVEPN